MPLIFCKPYFNSQTNTGEMNSTAEYFSVSAKNSGVPQPYGTIYGSTETTTLAASNTGMPPTYGSMYSTESAFSIKASK